MLRCCHSPPTATGHGSSARVADDTGSLRLRPLIVAPDDLPLIVDTELAGRHTSLAVLSMLMHAHRPDVEQSSRAWPRHFGPSARQRPSSTMTSCSPGYHPTPALVGGHS